MSKRLNWGILGTGSIARAFARGLAVSQTGSLEAVGSRSSATSEAFCKEFGGHACSSYEEVLANPKVDAVYIALPHHLHMEWTIRTAEAGKGILCEKPFTLNAIEAKRAIDAVRKAGVFFMEAFMYRCHPQIAKLRELLADGAIGQTTAAHAEFGFQAPEPWSGFRAEGRFGGGALMDVGTYCVSFLRLVAGDEPCSVHYACPINTQGYDPVGTGSLLFSNGFAGSFATAVHQQMVNGAAIYGKEGRIFMDSPWVPSQEATLRLLPRQGDMVEWRLHPAGGNLYAMEADSVSTFWEDGECPHMSINDTLANMETLDALRLSAGLHFEAEAKA